MSAAPTSGLREEPHLRSREEDELFEDGPFQIIHEREPGELLFAVTLFPAALSILSNARRPRASAPRRKV